MEKLLTTDEAAAALGVSRWRMEEWRRSGDGPLYVRMGHRTIRYRVSDLHRWLDQQVEAMSR